MKGGPAPPHGRRLKESRARWQQAKATQGYGRFPVPPDWTVQITPQTFGLAPNEEQTVDVSIEPKDPGFTGAKTFNVHVFPAQEGEPRQLVGGGTLSAAKRLRKLRWHSKTTLNAFSTA